MKRVRRMIIWLFGAIVLTFGLAACGWIYMTSNVAVPGYTIAEGDGDIEIRDYPELVVAEITTRGSRQEAVRAGFPPLAGYIFAKEREGEKIAMTAPVTQRAEGDEWTVQFIMPDGYTLDTLPRPTGSRVTLSTEAPIRRAAIRFSGWWDDESFAAREAKLRSWLAARGLSPDGAPIYAYYNDPFTPGFLRRKEVIFHFGR
ncbi:MAG: heme-binding protein [Paracoccaceae bacterium]